MGTDGNTYVIKVWQYVKFHQSLASDLGTTNKAVLNVNTSQNVFDIINVQLLWQLQQKQSISCRQTGGHMKRLLDALLIVSAHLKN